MKVQLGRQTGLALALLSTLLATLFAMGVFYVAQADGHSATRSFSATTVAPGAEITVTVELSAYGAGGSVTETLPAGFSFVSGSVEWVGGGAFDRSVNNQVRVVLVGEGVTSVIYKVTAPSAAGGPHEFSGNFVNFDGESMAVGGDSMVTVEEATGGNGGTDPEPNMAMLHPNNKAGTEDVRITIMANAGATIGGGRDINVTLPGFGIPSSIDDSDVILDGGDSYYGNPADVSVSGDTITITLPTRIAGTSDRAEISGDYSIIFKSSAGLSNPTMAAEDIEITVSDADADDDVSTVNIVKTASVKPTFVTRGGDAKVTAKGLRDGTTTVYLVNDDGGRGAALGTGTADDGVVEISIDTSGSTLAAGATADGDSDVGMNTLRVIDSNDGQVDDDFMLGIKPTVKLGSETAKRSANLEISVSDWYYGDINMVKIAGLAAEFVGDDVTSIDVGSDNKATFKVIVPGTVRTGDQEVKVYGDDADLNTTSATAMVNIVLLPLDVSPSTVVPGHRVTITGSGFATSQDVDSISIGGVPVDVPTDADSTSSGRVAVTVTVPMTVGNGDKTVKLTVATRTGEGEITVPKPSIELSPSESVPGSVISVRGSGFASDERVEVRFDGDIEEVGRADGSGDIHVRLEIPSDAGVGATNEVMVEVRSDDDDVSISATADHKTPGPAITVPETAQVGTLATISGTNFEPFTSLTVMIGGRDATPTSAETDKNGGFEVEARVPRLSAGSHTITVEDGSPDENSVTETFSVVTTAIVSTPEEVFGVLGDSLVSVWSLDNATKEWSAYFPGAPEGVSDLTGVSSRDIVWINVSEDVEFQGGMLTTGWNLISLE